MNDQIYRTKYLKYKKKCYDLQKAGGWRDRLSNTRSYLSRKASDVGKRSPEVARKLGREK